MKVQELLGEERQKDMKYSEERVKGALKKVIVSLEGTNSGVMSRLTKRYERLDRSQKLLKEKRDELNAHIKVVGDRIFDAEDAVVTRIIDTISCTVMLTAAQKAADKKPEHKVDYASAFAELSRLVPELSAKVEEITKKYTEIIEAKDTPTALRVSMKKEGLAGDMIAASIGFAAALAADAVSSWVSSFIKRFKFWAKDYDARLAKVKAVLH